MYRKLTLYIFLCLLFAFSVHAAGNLSIANDTIALKGVGTTLTSTFTINNTGNNSLAVTFTDQDLQPVNLTGGAINLPSISSITLPGNGSQNVSFSVTVGNIASLGTYLGNFTATTNESGSNDTVLISLNVTANPSLIITFTPVSGIQGQNVTGSLKINNTGNMFLKNLFFNLSDFVSGNDRIGPGNVTNKGIIENGNPTLVHGSTLGVGSLTTLTFALNIAVPEVTAGTYTGTLNVSNPEINTSAVTTVTVIQKGPSVSTSTTQMTWVNQLQQGQAGTLQVTNNGNVNGTAAISLTDFTGPATLSSSNFALSSSSFSLPIGSSNTVTITPQNLGNILTGTYTGNATITLDNGTFTQALTLVARDPSHSLSVPSSLTFSGQIRGNTTSRVFTIANDGDFDEGLINISNSINSQFNASLSSTQLSGLTKGSSSTINLSLFVPENQSTGTQFIGNVFVVAENISRTMQVFINPDSALLIEDLDVVVGGRRDSNVGDGDTISNEAEPGDRVEFEFKLQNTLEDLEIRDVEVEILIDDIDEGSDLDIESEDVDINEDDDEDVELGFTVPLLVEDGRYTVQIRVEGRDEDGVIHQIDRTVFLEVDKERHKIEIERAQVSPATLSCTQNFNVEVKVVNVGREDEDDVSVRITSSALGLDDVRRFSLDEGDDDEAERIISFSHPLPDIPEGTYTLSVVAFRDSAREDSETIAVNVRDCPVDTSTPGSNQGGETPVVIGQPGSAGSVVSTEGFFDALRSSPLYFPALVAIVVLLAVIVFLLLFKR